MERARKAMIELAYKSRAKFVIFPLQDVLGLGGESRINRPGTLGKWNWSWRVRNEMLTDSLAKEFFELVKAGNLK
jgi:4-alpha-glucanotransferase